MSQKPAHNPQSYYAYQEDYSFPQPDEPASFNPWLIRLPVLFVSGLLLLALVLLGIIAFVQVQFQERIIPGVTAGGLSLSNLTTEEAYAALQDYFEYDESAVFTFRDGTEFWQLTAGELGVEFDAQATVAEAFSHGHSDNVLGNVVDQALIWLNGLAVSPVIRYDQNIAWAELQNIAQIINRSPQNALLEIDGFDIQSQPGLSGRTLNVNRALAELNDAILSFQQGGEINLVVNETPPIAWDSELAAYKARMALSSPITLLADDLSLGPWVASIEQIQALLRTEVITHEDGSMSYDVTVDVEAYRPYLEQLASGLLTIPQDARFHFNEATGQLEVIRSGIAGRRLNVDATLQRLENAIFSENHTVQMVFDYVEPRYSNTASAFELGITEMVSEGRSYYAGSSESRRINIAQSIGRLDGIIVAPGEIFSFNQYIGDITPEEGFVEGFVIFGGRTIAGVGGGVCQVSTTIFRAAFYGGYPIVERYAHGYRVGYYEYGDPEGVGMDAAIYTPDLDFQFINDTDYHLLIQAVVNPQDNEVIFRFYSTNPGRQVVRQGPEIRNVQPALPTIYEANANLQLGQENYADYAAEGAYVEVTRVIQDLEGNVIHREIFASQYQPWAAIIEVAPNDPRLG